MCGIVGYIGKRKAYPILIKGLKRLEYRGYDSAGVAIISDDQQLNVYKTKGKVSDLENFVTQKDISGTIGIAHTRWATHGEPCSVNAHPHYSSSEKLALIHNGIIENYAVLKEKLQAKGYIFKSSTDTEVLVQLIEYMKVTNQVSLLTAVQLALGEVIGAYAIAILDKEHPDEIIAARKSSPLVVGIGENEFFLASDATPIVEYTDKVVYLEDGEIAVLNLGKELKVVNLNNVEMIPEIKKVELNLGQLEKGGYSHFMLKEIYEQPRTLQDCMRGRINVEADNVVLSAVIDHREKLLNAKRFIIVACGTSWHAGLIGKHLIESFCRIPVEVEYASEFRYRDPILTPRTLVVAISQSGETMDTLMALRHAREQGSKVLAICNTQGASIPRESDAVLYTHAGPEVAVASTKAFVAQITAAYVLGLYLAQVKGAMYRDEIAQTLDSLKDMPRKIQWVLDTQTKTVQEAAEQMVDAKSFLFLGRHVGYPVAMEGALKLKEIAYTFTEGFAAGELKHGPIALVDEGEPVVFIVPPARGRNVLHSKVISGIEEVKARGAYIIAVAEEHDPDVERYADVVFWRPACPTLMSPLVDVVPLQLFAMDMAKLKNYDVDKPRNLAKSVTVE